MEKARRARARASRRATAKATRKGGGKGYHGTCWNCGKVGHKANECHGVRPANNIDADPNEGEDMDIGGVWMIGNIEFNRPEDRTFKGEKEPVGPRGPPTPGTEEQW